MILWLVLAACSRDDDTDASESASTLTYYADVKPVLARHCTRCHNSDGLGMGDFTNIDELITLGPAIQSAVMDGRMPPPAADPGCQDYVGSDNLTLSDDEKAILVDWIDADSPLGDPADEPEIPVISGELADPNLILTMDQPYMPVYADPDAGGNEYRCFILEKPEDMQAFYITALAPIIDKDAITHHAVLYTQKTESLQEDLADYNDGDGIECMNAMGEASAQGMLTAWAPGMLPVEFPEGHGLYVGDDDQIILQMHYYASPDQQGVTDQSGFAFRTASSVETEVFMAAISDYSFAIPANDASYTYDFSFDNSFIDLNIFGVFPHMHLLGQGYSATIDHSDGSETCLTEGSYNFNNQMTYMFNEPIPFSRGESLNLSCNWNNSTSNPDLPYDEPQTTYYGERTDEEMCYFFTFMARK
ncbi:MAG: hypothetical protein AAFV53_21230 [Myxococcota bacterium]